MNNNFIPQLQQRFPSISTVEKRIARVILDDPKRVISMTVTQLAGEAGTSAGSVANFAVSFGFKGFTDMKLTLAQQLQTQVDFQFDNVLPQDDPKAAMRKMIDNASRSFESTLSAMQDELQKAADILHTAKSIEIYGAGSSLPVVYDVQYRLLRLGLPAHVQLDALTSCLSAAQLTAQDAAVVISNKGRTTSTLTAAKVAKEHGAKIIALTSYPDCPLSRMSDISLISVSYESAEDREAVVARLTQLLIIDSICAWIAAQRGSDALTHLDQEIEMLEMYRMKDTRGKQK